MLVFSPIKPRIFCDSVKMKIKSGKKRGAYKRCIIHVYVWDWLDRVVSTKRWPCAVSGVTAELIIQYLRPPPSPDNLFSACAHHAIFKWVVGIVDTDLSRILWALRDGKNHSCILGMRLWGKSGWSQLCWVTSFLALNEGWALKLMELTSVLFLLRRI